MMYSVMLVDNEPIIPKGLMKLIDWRSCDCQISAVARDGIDAVRQIREQAPDILITDIRMPEWTACSCAPGCVSTARERRSFC